MATLRGHSRPVKIDLLESVLDHTYVTCGGGHCWPCWGDCLDGTVLRTGQGSSAQASNLAGPLSHAGIVYGVTGLCHQTANRILWPAGITVSDSNGYEITEFFFGTYGGSAMDWIDHRNKFIAIAGEIGACGGLEDPESKPWSEAESMLLRDLVDVYERSATQERVDGAPGQTSLDHELLAELWAHRVRGELGAASVDSWLPAVQQIQSAYLTEKAELDRALLAGRISGVAFARRSNARMNVALREVAKVMDPRHYEALFDFRPGAEINVIRPDICAAVYDVAAR